MSNIESRTSLLDWIRAHIKETAPRSYLYSLVGAEGEMVLVISKDMKKTKVDGQTYLRKIQTHRETCDVKQNTFPKIIHSCELDPISDCIVRSFIVVYNRRSLKTYITKATLRLKLKQESELVK
jgi:hypothetical protein